MKKSRKVSPVKKARNGKQTRQIGDCVVATSNTNKVMWVK